MLPLETAGTWGVVLLTLPGACGAVFPLLLPGSCVEALFGVCGVFVPFVPLGALVETLLSLLSVCWVGLLGALLGACGAVLLLSLTVACGAVFPIVWLAGSCVETLLFGLFGVCPVVLSGVLGA